LHGHRKDINHLAFDPATHLLVSVSDDGTLRVWDVKGVYDKKEGYCAAASGVADETVIADEAPFVAAADADEAVMCDGAGASESNVPARSPIARRLSRSASGRGPSGHSTTVAAAVPASRQDQPAPRRSDSAQWAEAHGTTDATSRSAAAAAAFVSHATPESARCRVVHLSGDAANHATGLEDSKQRKLTALGVHPDGGIVAVGSDDGTVRLVQIAEVSTKASDAATLAAATYASTIQPEKSLRATRNVTVIDFDSEDDTPCISVATGEDGCVDVGSPGFCGSGMSSFSSLAEIWTPLQSPRVLSVLNGHSKEVVTAEFCADGTVLATTSHDEGRAILWRWARGVTFRPTPLRSMPTVALHALL
jgi:hypothetical protein